MPCGEALQSKEEMKNTQPKEGVVEGDKEVAVGGGVGRAARDREGWNNLVETGSPVS